MPQGYLEELLNNLEEEQQRKTQIRKVSTAPKKISRFSRGSINQLPAISVGNNQLRESGASVGIPQVLSTNKRNKLRRESITSNGKISVTGETTFMQEQYSLKDQKGTLTNMKPNISTTSSLNTPQHSRTAMYDESSIGIDVKSIKSQRLSVSSILSRTTCKSRTSSIRSYCHDNPNHKDSHYSTKNSINYDTRHHRQSTFGIYGGGTGSIGGTQISGRVNSNDEVFTDDENINVQNFMANNLNTIHGDLSVLSNGYESCHPSYYMSNIKESNENVIGNVFSKLVSCLKVKVDEGDKGKVSGIC